MDTDFRAVTVHDRELVFPLISKTGICACDYNFNSVFLWRHKYRHQICIRNGAFFVKAYGRIGSCYLYPAAGSHICSDIEFLREDAMRSGHILKLVCITDEQKETIEHAMPGCFAWEEDRDGWDYLYLADALADLKGRRYHSKKNHINRFLSYASDWNYETITERNAPECLNVFERWKQAKAQEDRSYIHDIDAEGRVIKDALRYYKELFLYGGAIRVNGSIAAFSIGSLINDQVFDIHVEKALESIPGIYAVINREMAVHIRTQFPDVVWMNREDDMGLENLRKAKMSYHPDQLLRKHIATLKEM